VNLDELVRAALAEEARAEPDEAGAYERFLRHRRRSALVAAASAGLAVALVLAVAIGGALAVRGGDGGEAIAPVTPAPTTSRRRPPGRPRGRWRPPGPPRRRCPSPPPGWCAGSVRGSS
jgi:hypothetical protein